MSVEDRALAFRPFYGRDLVKGRWSRPSAAHEANSSNASISGTTPGVNIGSTPTSGSLVAGDTSGGPSFRR